MKHNIKHIESLKLQNRLLWTFTYFVVLGGLLYVTQDRVLSPCSDQGCHIQVKTVYAETTELEEVSLNLTREFGPYGLDVLTQAFLVAKNESGWNKNAKGWNCHYMIDDKQISTACKIEDRSKAWSVDCGIMQINVKGQECPEKLLNIKENIQKAADMYKHRGWSPWVAAKNLGFVK